MPMDAGIHIVQRLARKNHVPRPRIGVNLRESIPPLKGAQSSAQGFNPVSTLGHVS